MSTIRDPIKGLKKREYVEKSIEVDKEEIKRIFTEILQNLKDINIYSGISIIVNPKGDNKLDLLIVDTSKDNNSELIYEVHKKLATISSELYSIAITFHQLPINKDNLFKYPGIQLHDKGHRIIYPKDIFEDGSTIIVKKLEDVSTEQNLVDI